MIAERAFGAMSQQSGSEGASVGANAGIWSAVTGLGLDKNYKPFRISLLHQIDLNAQVVKVKATYSNRT
jgi:hypothetical protein